MDKPQPLYEIRTTHANGARDSVLVPRSVAGVAYRAALAKAWRGKAGALVEILTFR